jgi:hypothetical protein
MSWQQHLRNLLERAGGPLDGAAKRSVLPARDPIKSATAWVRTA